MVALFTAAIFVAAFLLFLIQPLAARLILPNLGGSPAVWTGTMMFFQIMLLAGYGYAHWVGKLRPRPQAIIHGLVLLSCLVFIPLGLPEWWKAWSGSAQGVPPLVGLLVGLAASVGIPFFAISSASPLIQTWFARTGHARAHDPYFLYAASNTGSLMGLLAYPLVVEPALGLSEQGWGWGIGYVACAALLIGCWAVATRRARRSPGAGVERLNAKDAKAANGAKYAKSARDAKAANLLKGSTQDKAPVASAPIVLPATKGDRAAAWRERLTWIALAAAPSSLSLGVTQYLTTDVAAIPMLWVMPLAIYLLTYVAAFSRFRAQAERVGRIILPIAAVAVTAAMMVHARTPLWVIGALHLTLLASGGLVCHCRLAALRPTADRLTEFYFLASLGGAIGGAFNSVAAPLLFNVVLEYPLAIAGCCALLLIGKPPSRRQSRADKATDATADAGATPSEPEPSAPRFAFPRPLSTRRLGLFRALAPALLAVILTAAYLIAADSVVMLRIQRIRSFDVFGRIPITPGLIAQVVTVFIPCVIAFLLSRFPLVFAAIIGTLAGQVTVTPTAGSDIPHTIIHVERTFFGVCMVADRPGVLFRAEEPPVPALRIFQHGTTLHGRQWLDSERQHEPLSYYTRTGPVGDTFARMAETARTVAVIGLGAGTIASYGRPGDAFDFFEIDPAVARIAQDPRFFTFLSGSQARTRVILGDGRIKMAQQPAAMYDLIVLDAFSSDSIPVHLLTIEALQIYRSRLKPNGVLLVHISNVHFDLLPPMSRAARDLRTLLIQKTDSAPPEERFVTSGSDSEWVVLCDNPEFLYLFADAPGWQAIANPRTGDAWTDDHADVLGALRFN